MSMADLVAAPLENVPLGELTLTLKRLNDQDIAAIDEWLKAKYVKIARMAIDPDEHEDEKKIVIQAALEGAMELTWMVPPGSSMMSNQAGLARVIYQACTDMSITLQDIHRQLFYLPNVERASEYLNAIRPKVPGGPKESDAEKKPEPKPQQETT